MKIVAHEVLCVMGVGSKEELIDQMYTDLASRRIKDQLSYLSVERIFKREDLGMPGALCIQRSGGHILLLSTSFVSYKEIGITVGHELAHAYLFKFGASILNELGEALSESRRRIVAAQEEFIAEAFGHLWAKDRYHLFSALKLYMFSSCTRV